MRLFVIPAWLTCALFVALAAFALRRGGRLERIVAAVVAIEAVVGGYLFPAGPARPSWRPPVYDGVVLATCLACLVRADRYWSVWACSFALLAEISDLTMFTLGVTAWASASASLVWSYALASTVLWGVLTRRAAADDPQPAPIA